LRMQGVTPRFSRTPGAVHRSGPVLGGDNEAVYRGLLGLTEVEIASLKAKSVI